MSERSKPAGADAQPHADTARTATAGAHHHHDHDHAACIELFSRLSEYLDNELDDVTCKDIEAHLADCPCCSVCLETLKRTVAFCREVEERPVPDTLSQRLQEIVAELAAPKTA